ncbi:MAG: alpha/beta hydrolase [Anaerolineaceae bacterium]|nr:alpha/beta hydrolase [Anaerolineaceae bacterium]
MKLFESDVTANGVNLHVYRTGTKKPPLLFAHGRSDNGLCFWPIAQHFADEYEIILYDARDHGQSEKTDSRITLLERAQDLAGLIEALQLQKPILVGHSLGAATVSLLAGLLPQTPASIVLEDPPPFALMGAQSEEARARHQGWEQFIGSIQGKEIAEIIALGREGTPTWPEAEWQPWAQSKLQYHLKPFGEDYIDAATGSQTVAQITCPTLLITADLNKGAIYPPEAADAWVASLPNARHVNIPGAGHNIRREQPDAFLTAVRDFLNENV